MTARKVSRQAPLLGEYVRRLVEEHAPEATRRRLLLSGVQEFALRGYDATTTRAICAAADLSSAALYVHFESKEALLYEISRIGHAGVLKEIRAEMGGTTFASHAARLAAFMRAFVRFHAEANALARVCQLELRSLSPEHFRMIASMRRDTTKLIVELIEAGVGAGEFVLLDPRVTSLAILSLGIDVARWFRYDGNISSEELADGIAQLAVRMVINSPVAAF